MTLAEQIKGLPDDAMLVVTYPSVKSISRHFDPIPATEFKALLADAQRYREALEHYAAAKTWDECSSTWTSRHYDAHDGNGYDIAREALGDKV